MEVSSLKIDRNKIVKHLQVQSNHRSNEITNDCFNRREEKGRAHFVTATWPYSLRQSFGMINAEHGDHTQG